MDDHLTVITGSSGSGKTSVLEAIAIAAGTLLMKIEDAVAPSISAHDARMIAVKQGSSLVRQEQFPVKIRAQGSYGIPISWTRSLNSKKGRMTRADAAGITRVEGHLQERVSAGEDVILPIVAYYDANRFASIAGLIPVGSLHMPHRGRRLMRAVLKGRWMRDRLSHG